MMRLQCCAGLAEMANRQYKSAAKKLTTANLDHCGELTDIMSTQVIEWIFRYTHCGFEGYLGFPSNTRDRVIFGHISVVNPLALPNLVLETLK